MMQTVNERLRDESIAHAVWISRYSTGVAARMVKTLNDSDAELTARLLVALAGDTTYREWFLRQPYTRQKQIVGETRAKLIRDGGMSPDEFYTDKGEWLTLKQLRERDAQAFRKAGI